MRLGVCVFEIWQESLNFIETLKTDKQIKYSRFKSYPNPKSGAKIGPGNLKFL